MARWRGAEEATFTDFILTQTISQEYTLRMLYNLSEILPRCYTVHLREALAPKVQYTGSAKVTSASAKGIHRSNNYNN